ncbi:hypothetical protein predicted by Glimmer/Critica [Acetobacter ghanensis]|uniref:Uncharacterized protein n=1 Tax=Acetobacter ghanensis TaxID=431306 RepID=A0A0U5F4L6_9PROT|nr:hypothetical protein predicted by Glimmer/Critica [Acetobacter ghanensis]
MTLLKECAFFRHEASILLFTFRRSPRQGAEDG